MAPQTLGVRGAALTLTGLLLVGALLAGCAARPAPAPPPGPGTLRVMTWNVQTARHDPAEWAAVIARLRPDVLGLQEVCAGEVRELADLLRREHGLGYTAVPGPVRPPPGEIDAPVNAALGPACGTAPDAVDFGLGVLSRLPVADPTVTLYPPDRRDEQRGYLTVRVSLPDGREFPVVTTHLGLAGVAADQVRRLVDATAAEPLAVVLGDLNLGPTAAELAPLRRGFVEVDPRGRQETTTLGKIDYVFARGLGAIGPVEAPAVDASDHRPLLGVLGVDAPG